MSTRPQGVLSDCSSVSRRAHFCTCCSCQEWQGTEKWPDYWIAKPLLVPSCGELSSMQRVSALHGQVRHSGSASRCKPADQKYFRFSGHLEIQAGVIQLAVANPVNALQFYASVELTSQVEQSVDMHQPRVSAGFKR